MLDFKLISIICVIISIVKWNRVLFRGILTIYSQINAVKADSYKGEFI